MSGNMEYKHEPEEAHIERIVEWALERQLPLVLAKMEPAHGEVVPGTSSAGRGSKLFS